MPLSTGAERKQKSGGDKMPGMNERKRWMRGESNTARGDYGKESYAGGGKVMKKKYKKGGEAEGQKGRKYHA